MTQVTLGAGGAHSDAGKRVSNNRLHQLSELHRFPTQLGSLEMGEEVASSDLAQLHAQLHPGTSLLLTEALERHLHYPFYRPENEALNVYTICLKLYSS